MMGPLYNQCTGCAGFIVLASNPRHGLAGCRVPDVLSKVLCSGSSLALVLGSALDKFGTSSASWLALVAMWLAAGRQLQSWHGGGFLAGHSAPTHIQVGVACVIACFGCLGGYEHWAGLPRPSAKVSHLQ